MKKKQPDDEKRSVKWLGVGVGSGGVLGGVAALYADAEERERGGQPVRRPFLLGRRKHKADDA